MSSIIKTKLKPNQPFDSTEQTQHSMTNINVIRTRDLHLN